MRKHLETQVEQSEIIKIDMSKKVKREKLINIDEGSTEKIEEQAYLEKEEERKKKLSKKIRITVCSILTGLLVLSVCVLIYVKKTADTTLPFKEINIDEYKELNNKNETSEDIEDTIDIDIVDYSNINTPANINEYHKVDVVVNTKLSGTSYYKDYESSYYYGLTEVISGYDEVIKYVEEYNKTGKKKVDIPEKERFNEQLTLVLMEVALKYPGDYPTYLGENKVYKIPNIELSLTGTYKDNTDTDYSNMIVIDNSTFKINEAISITDEPEELNISNGIRFKYIITLPINTKEEDYIIKIKCDSNEAIYKGYKIDK